MNMSRLIWLAERELKVLLLRKRILNIATDMVVIIKIYGGTRFGKRVVVLRVLILGMGNILVFRARPTRGSNGVATRVIRRVVVRFISAASMVRRTAPAGGASLCLLGRGFRPSPHLGFFFPFMTSQKVNARAKGKTETTSKGMGVARGGTARARKIMVFCVNHIRYRVQTVI